MLYCIPVLLDGAGRLQFGQCKVIPGVMIKKFVGPISSIVKNELKKGSEYNCPHEFSPNYMVLIDEDLYVEKLRVRIKNDGVSSEVDLRHIDALSIAKQVLMALVFAGPVSFSFGGVFGINKHDGRYRFGSWSRTEFYTVGYSNASALHKASRSLSPINPYNVAYFGRLLDPYYRSGTFLVDRYGMALAHFWGAMGTGFLEQTLVGLTSAMECLLSTKNIEISHMLSERTAVLLSDDCDERLLIYKQVKEVYGVRSKLVHGKAFMKRGRVNNESLCVTPRFVRVPSSTMGVSYKLVLSVFVACLKNKVLMDILQKESFSEDTITKKMDEYFNRLLLGNTQ